MVLTPVQAPEANGCAERFVRTVRSECLDRILIANTSHLERTVKVSADQYNSCRPHRSLGLVPPNGRPPVKAETIGQRITVRRVTDLAGCCTSASAWRERDRVCAPYGPHDAHLRSGHARIHAYHTLSSNVESVFECTVASDERPRTIETIATVYAERLGPPNTTA